MDKFLKYLTQVLTLDVLETFCHSSILNKAVFRSGKKQGLLANQPFSSWCWFGIGEINFVCWWISRWGQLYQPYCRVWGQWHCVRAIVVECEWFIIIHLFLYAGILYYIIVINFLAWNKYSVFISCINEWWLTIYGGKLVTRNNHYSIMV